MRRIPELDAIRALAAIGIMVDHLPIRSAITPVLVYGVDLFFVLSGYLITAIILRNSGSNAFLFNFYVRRSLRIWPLYYFVLLIVVAINFILPYPYPLDALPNYLTYTQGIQYYWSNKVPPFTPWLSHTWTLAIEEQYYIFWPALLCLVGRRWVIPLAAMLLLMSLTAREAGYNALILLTRCDGFAFGAILATMMLNPEQAMRRRKTYLPAFAVSAFVALLYPVLAWSRARTGITVPDSIRVTCVNLLGFSLIGTIICYAGRPILAPLRDRRLCYLGLISYGIYFYHLIIYSAADTIGIGMGAVGITLRFAVTFAVAALSWRYFEQPILALKDRFQYGRDTTLATIHKSDAT